MAVTQHIVRVHNKTHTKRRNARKLTRAQKLAGFGGKRAQSAVKHRKRNMTSPKRRRNIERGFYSATGFHPLRSSRDYDPDRAGDDYSQRSAPRKRKAKKSRSRKNPGEMMHSRLGC